MLKLEDTLLCVCNTKVKSVHEVLSGSVGENPASEGPRMMNIE